MRVLVKLIILLAVIAVAAYLYATYRGGAADSGQARKDPTEPPVRVEEKYGFTTETVEP